MLDEPPEEARRLVAVLVVTVEPGLHEGRAEVRDGGIGRGHTALLVLALEHPVARLAAPRADVVVVAQRQRVSAQEPFGSIFLPFVFSYMEGLVDMLT